MHRFANPNRFLRLAAVIVPWSGAATVLLFAAGLVYALILSPPDYQQSETVRTMYVQVPAAWMPQGAYAFLAPASGFAILWQPPSRSEARRVGEEGVRTHRFYGRPYSYKKNKKTN